MDATTNASVTLTLDGTNQSISLPLRHGTIGPSVADISKLYAQVGLFTYDPGYGMTAACDSKITYIDGDEGILLHRGYPIDQLAEKSTFLEVAHLLLNGDLPNRAEKAEFEDGVMRHTMLHEQLRSFYNGFRRDAHPMAVLCGVVGALSAFYHDSLDINNEDHRRISAFRLIAKLPTIAAWAYKYSIGQPFIYPRNDLSYAANFLHMMNAVPAEPYHVSPVLERAMDRIFILHADHEQNASTSTVRLAGSTGANPFACIAAGIASLWGPAHGGANEAVLKMLDEIGDAKHIPSFIEKVKDKSSHIRLMGFGHRVYKNYDPRAKIMQETCHEVLKELGIKDDKTLELAMGLESVALHDEYFVSKKLYPNVDFYSGIILKAMGFPTSMFTVLFAVARTVGWISQWKEMIEDPTQRIGRPRQLYTGPTQRDYVPLDQQGVTEAIRRAGPADAESAHALVRSAYAKWVPVIGREPQPMTIDYEAAIRDERVDLMVDGETLLGLIHLTSEPDHLMIYNVAVAPEAQGRGLGRALMSHAEEVAREQELSEIRLYTNVKFGENIRLYQRLGYRIDRTDASSGFERVYMSKALA